MRATCSSFYQFLQGGVSIHIPRYGENDQIGGVSIHEIQDRVIVGIADSTEQHGLSVSDKISIFDAVCTSDTGEMFIVEMQGLPQNCYADRMVSYASFPIRMQLEQKLKYLHESKGKPMDYASPLLTWTKPFCRTD